MKYNIVEIRLRCIEAAAQAYRSYDWRRDGKVDRDVISCAQDILGWVMGDYNKNAELIADIKRIELLKETVRPT